MCTVCGCSTGETTVGEGHHSHEHGHHHHDGHQHADHHHPHSRSHDADDHVHYRPVTGDVHYGLGPAHAHAPGLSQARMVRIEQEILGKNNGYAQSNRQHFTQHGILALNLVSSPGSGKTSLLVKTIEMLKHQVAVSVIEGDQQTSQDADRIRNAGAPAIQINTGKGCHLDAHMVGHAIERLQLQDDSILMIENVGNLVCPSAFDLGEAHKVVILSVTEGEEKPLKYPDMFHASNLMILNKIDLLPYVEFDVEKCIEHARQVNPNLQVIQLSANSGHGMQAWIDWLMAQHTDVKQSRMQNVEGLLQRIRDLEAELAQKAS
jgi:hydrogenase nickel incorporation protein HypB